MTQPKKITEILRTEGRWHNTAWRCYLFVAYFNDIISSYDYKACIFEQVHDGSTTFIEIS
jgi:hypothetical protein